MVKSNRWVSTLVAYANGPIKDEVVTALVWGVVIICLNTV